MLKIKDNIDLKELEKHGLLLEYECNNRTGEVWVSEIYQLRDENSSNYIIRFDLYFDLYNKKNYHLTYIEETGVSILYDLIKDGLVEKVED